MIQVQLARSEMDTRLLLQRLIPNLQTAGLVLLYFQLGSSESNGFRSSANNSAGEERVRSVAVGPVRSCYGFRWRRERVRCAGETSFERSARLCCLF